MHDLALLLQMNQLNFDRAIVPHMAWAMLAFIPLIILAVLAIVIVPFWFICKKAGFSPWLSLLNFVPLGNLALLYVLAFADWKVMPFPPPYWQSQPPYPPQSPYAPQNPYPPQPPYPPYPPAPPQV